MQGISHSAGAAAADAAAASDSCAAPPPDRRPCPRLLQAFEWIAENAVAPAVVSMSVAGDMSPSVNEAARRLVEDRLISLVVAAGNSYESACLKSPASSPWVISVAASDDQDRRWKQSNWWVQCSGRAALCCAALCSMMARSAAGAGASVVVGGLVTCTSCLANNSGAVSELDAAVLCR